MLIDILWPSAFNLRVEEIELAGERLMISICGLQKRATCPDCQQPSERINSHYCRCPADLPCGGYAVQLMLTVPRFFCDNAACSRKTFAAPFPEILRRYARRTTRLANQQHQVGYAMGGEAGSRLVQGLGMTTSADTLIRLVRGVSEPTVETPRVLGVDDWAKRKGQSYGTILVDLEKQTVVDLLEDRSAEGFRQWLEAHPGVEIITRDRGHDYIEGATTGAPEAVQIADRFHLLQNLVETLKRMLEKQSKPLRQAARAVAGELQQEAPPPQTEREPEAREMGEGQPSLTLTQLRFEEVKALQQQGWSQRRVAQHLNLSRQTVRKYFALETCPKRPAVPQSTSMLTAYLPYLSKRWQEGCQNMRQLHLELQTQGFSGHYASVYRAVKRLQQEGQLVPGPVTQAVSIPNLSVTQAAWLLLHPDERLEALDCRLRDKLCELCEEINIARQLAQSFCEMIRARAAEKLEGWLCQAEQAGITAFKNFAAGLRRDYAAIQAALTYEWSNGQVEGQVNRLKFIKRQMYGRAKFDLLRKRVLGMPGPT